MSREIKFRAWNDVDKMIIDWGVLKVSPVFFTSILNGKVRHHAAMQFTGLKDINGIEIYEGDIVKSHFYGEDYNGIAKINYDDSSAAFVYDSAEQDAFVYDAESGQLEVIGNIYENPELLTTNP